MGNSKLDQAKGIVDKWTRRLAADQRHANYTASRRSLQKLHKASPRSPSYGSYKKEAEYPNEFVS